VLGLLLTLKGGRINKCSKCANFFQEAFSFFCVLFHGVRSRQSSFDFFKKKLCDKDLFNKAPVKIRKKLFCDCSRGILHRILDSISEIMLKFFFVAF